MKTQRNRRGFTLVELSIVLVIIGLLIGGILVAQSMITTSKISASVLALGQFDAGVNNFQTKYNALPGDAVSFGGNGDLAIDGTYFGVDNFTCEAANFWSNMMPETYAGYPCSLTVPAPGLIPPSTIEPNRTVPLAKIGKGNNSYFAASALGNTSGYYDATNISNYYIILSGVQGTVSNGSYYPYVPTDSNTSAVRPPDLLALDTKMDDGNANTGNVRSGVMTDDGGYATPLLNSPANCANGSGQYTAKTTYECTPFVRIGTQTGIAQ